MVYAKQHQMVLVMVLAIIGGVSIHPNLAYAGSARYDTGSVRILVNCYPDLNSAVMRGELTVSSVE